MAWLLSCTAFWLTLIMLLQSSPIAAQNGGNITVGQYLLAASNGSSWLSPSGDFAFGFHQLPNSNNGYLLAIWYAKIPDTIVWHANAGNPVPYGSSVKITADEGLVLSDSHGNTLWNASNELLRGGRGVSYAFMNDTGNFVLISSNENNPVWQSFDHPTDTLLPGQSLGVNGMLTSRLTEDNYTTGRFQYRLTSEGRMVLNVRDLTTGYAYAAYHVSGRADASESKRFVYNESGYQYILRKNGSRYNMLPDYYTPSQAFYQRTTLSFDGVLIWYSVSKTSVSDDWSIFQVAPGDICLLSSNVNNLGSGVCGSNSICILGDDKRPTCKCAQGYSLVDPNQQYGNCKADFKLDRCDEGYAERSTKGEYSLVQLPNTDFVHNDYERLDFDNEADCKNACLKDCLCAAASFRLSGDSSGCWKKKAPLSHGRKEMKTTMTFWMKVGNVNNSDPLHTFDSIAPVKAENKVNSQIKVLFGSSVSINLLLLSAIGLGIVYIYQKKQLKVLKEGQRKTLRKSNNIHCFTYKELKEATNGFKEELGRGSFGIVYKGMISEGGVTSHVAVKMLDRVSSDTDKEFKTEVNVIGKTHHKNLVQLEGFCEEEDQRLLVYEYMSNGSLADYLFSGLRPSWTDRVQIAQGIARGLLYLHEECSNQIIHCDIKPQNILLDEFQNARIADFGLAKLLGLNQTHTNTAIRGTKGYVAPEWFRNKPVTLKVDVYSFGVLLLEIICCRKSVCIDLVEEGGAILTDLAFDCYQSSRLDSLVKDDMEAHNDKIRLKRYVMISLWCIQEDPSLRPAMRTVTQMLEGVAEVPNNPPGPTTSFSITNQY